MKAVTEFPGFVLSKALQAKNALAAEGKTPEEIQQSLGTTYKLEGDKLTYFINAIDVAGQNSASLKRVVIMRLGEGENPPARSTQIGELCFVPEMLVLTMTKPPVKADAKGGRKGRGGGGRGGGGGGGKGGPKESPWGLSPEEKAAKAGKKAGGTSNKPT